MTDIEKRSVELARALMEYFGGLHTRSDVEDIQWRDDLKGDFEALLVSAKGVAFATTSKENPAWALVVAFNWGMQQMAGHGSKSEPPQNLNS